MVTKLSIDTKDLIALGHDLRIVATEFDGAETNADTIAAAAGHEAAASKIRDFANNWDGRRKKMLEAIASLSDATLQVGEGFEQLDTDLGASLRGDK